MKKIYKLCFSIFAIIIIMLDFVQYSQKIGYNFIVINNETKNSIAKRGTLLIFKKCDIKDLAEYDIVRINDKDMPVVRILKINKDENTLDISNEEFSSKTKTIAMDGCIGKLAFHINDYDKIENKCLKPYKSIIRAIPIILLALSMICLSVYRLKINNEDADFTYYDNVVALHNNKKFSKSLHVSDNKYVINDKVQYNSSVDSSFVPNFCSAKKEYITMSKNLNHGKGEKHEQL